MLPLSARLMAAPYGAAREPAGCSQAPKLHVGEVLALVVGYASVVEGEDNGGEGCEGRGEDGDRRHGGWLGSGREVRSFWLLLRLAVRESSW